MDLFILAGEASGDMQGALLIAQLLKIDPTLKIAAVAGPHMRKLPITCIEPMESLQVIGFIDVLFALPRIIQLFLNLRKKILALNPKAVITIDYPGFNLRMQTSLKKKGFLGKQIHYICPTVWAWGKRRIPSMAKSLDLLLTTLPFEPACFKGSGLKTEYVGHPLTEAISNFIPDPTFRERFHFAPTDKLLALFPGSREQEVKRNLPLMRKAAESLQAKDPHLKVVICSPHPSISGDVPSNENYNLMRYCHLAIAKSGTIILELALHKTPTIVAYAVKPLDVFIITKILKIALPFYSLPNIILQKELFSELYGPHLTETTLRIHAENLWFNEKNRTLCIQNCQQLWDALGANNASKNAAEKMIAAIRKSPFPKKEFSES
jgi:lipid-A-disaccharide synthase